MRAVDTTGMEPLAHPVAAIQDIALRLREDVVSEPNSARPTSAARRRWSDGLFLVPKVIESSKREGPLGGHAVHAVTIQWGWP
jgi:aspartyl-tRNA(Asn)/glutamyl-tRNA(Gln) amidotransferase subunit C